VKNRMLPEQSTFTFSLHNPISAWSTVLLPIVDVRENSKL